MIDVDEHFRVSKYMTKYGGSFFAKIGEALFRADLINAAKLKAAFPEEWQKYKDWEGVGGNDD